MQSIVKPFKQIKTTVRKDQNFVLPVTIFIYL